MLKAMSLVKTNREIAAMRRGGALLSRALQAAVKAVRSGVTMKELDTIAREAIEAGGGKPSFLSYTTHGSKPFPATLCISRNDEVVHGIGTREEALVEGDLVGLDIGCWYEGLCTDMAVTVPVGAISPANKELLLVTRQAMRAGVAAAKVGESIRAISAAIEAEVDQQRYGIVKALVGHGVGHAVHEAPHVPNYVSKSSKDVPLQAGMCLALEPMLTLGTDEVVTAEDGWTITTADGSSAAHFEVTIAILDQGPEILTPEPEIGL